MSEAADLLQRLIRCDSTNPPGNEAAAAKVLAEWLRERGIPPQIEEIEPGRANLIARVRFGLGGPALMLNTHLDVVPAGEGWVFPPFAATIEGGRVYGRGAADAKGPLAAMAVALARVSHDARTALSGEVLLTAVADEEGASAGARRMVEGIQADAAIVGEPTGLRLITCHKGSLRPVVEIRGRAAHAAQPAEGMNAIAGAMALLVEVDRQHRAYAAKPHPLVGAPTIVPVLVTGGEALNMVPERCAITFDRRLVPGEREEAVVEALNDTLDRFNLQQPGFTARIARFEPSTGGPSETAADDPLVLTCRAALEQIGQDSSLGGMQVNCDMSHFRRAGIPTVVYGPGEPRQMHTIDESIDISELERGVEGYGALIRAVLAKGAP